MEHMAADPRFPPNLKELQLYAVYFSAQWASELVKASSNLTLLDMSHVGFLEGEGLPDFQPIRSLRYTPEDLIFVGPAKMSHILFAQ